jgi:hypothetical protein
MRGTHKIGNPMVCPKCSKEFWWKSTFQNHQKNCGLEKTVEVFNSITLLGQTVVTPSVSKYSIEN